MPKQPIVLEWNSHPVTQELRRLCEEAIVANEKAISNLVLSKASVSEVDTHVLAQYRGYIFALADILDTDTFFEESFKDDKTRGIT